ncbi:MAG TPA: glycosyltransferase family 4 protein [Thermoanaerobaculia bacterium]
MTGAMRVLMFGWEFPPQFSGGLGVACEGLVRGLLQTGAEVVLVLPRYPHRKSSGKLRILEALDEPAPAPSRSLPAGGLRPAALRVRRVATAIRPYPESAAAETSREEIGLSREGPSTAEAAPSLYGPNLATEVLRYAARAAAIARRERFDVIHAHDWMTFPAGLEARRVSGKPLVVHVHATEYDRAGDGGNPFVREIEREGVARADRVIAVSRYTAQRLGREYGVPRRHLRVVHNAIDAGRRERRDLADGDAPLVLFAGRVTWQKGPEYFVEAAARVARELPEARFAVAGSGDRLLALRERVRQLGLERRVLFTGFLPPGELDRLYRRADVYVMPSFSEPFGLTALEALRHGTPVIVSRGAGVSEVVRNVLTVDFGDVEDLASKILSVLLFAPLSTTLSRRGGREVDRLSWRRSAERVRSVYAELAHGLDATPAP